MKRKITAFLLAALLAFSLGLTALTASDVCFVALNYNLLELDYQAISVRGTYYVPMSCFTTFGPFYSYFSDSNSATLFTAEKQIYFEMTSGNTYDAEGNYYSASAIYRGGVVYAPVSFVCTQFGLTWSFIAGDGYGDILRICDSPSVLSDKDFLNAASTMMQTRYNQYHSTQTPSTGAPATPSPPPTDPGSHADAQVSLSFAGLPDAESLNLLESYGYTACFFLTAGQVRENPDAVRRLAGGGHSLGVFCGDDPEADYEEVSNLIFEAARVKTLFITSSASDAEAVQAAATDLRLVYVDYTIDAWQNGQGFVRGDLITTLLETSSGRAHILFAVNEASPRLVGEICIYLDRMHFGVLPVRETDF